jgi:hypothetical protein
MSTNQTRAGYQNSHLFLERIRMKPNPTLNIER